MKLASLALTFLSFLSLTACAQRDTGLGSDSAASQMDQTDSVESEGNVMMQVTDGADGQALVALTPDQIAATIAAKIDAKFPGGCAVATATGANVAIVFTDCTGPRHLAHLTGELDLAVSLDAVAGSIDIHGTSASMMVNNAEMQIDSSAVYSRSGDTRTIVVHSHGTGTGPRGNAIDHSGDYTVTWNPTTQCNTVTGHWQTDLSNSVGAAERSNDVDLERCAQMCPTGTVTHHFIRGASLTITFDGTATAQWSTSLGGSGTIALQCQ